MNANELATRLGEMYRNAQKGEMECMIHLFGIKFAEQIALSGVAPAQLAKLAGISKAYGTEINKGIKLARYVEPKT